MDGPGGGEAPAHPLRPDQSGQLVRGDPQDLRHPGLYPFGVPLPMQQEPGEPQGAWDAPGQRVLVHLRVDHEFFERLLILSHIKMEVEKDGYNQ